MFHHKPTPTNEIPAAPGWRCFKRPDGSVLMLPDLQGTAQTPEPIHPMQPVRKSALSLTPDQSVCPER